VSGAPLLAHLSHLKPPWLQSPGGFFVDERPAGVLTIQVLEVVQGLWLIKLL
jgi:hypothetical protein